MLDSDYPRAAQIRRALLNRATTLSRLIGVPRSGIAKKALNDSSFLHKVAAGGNFTIRNYARMMKWIDRRHKQHTQRQATGFVKREKRRAPKRSVNRRK